MVAKSKVQPEEEVSSKDEINTSGDVPLVDILSLAENSINNLKNILDTFDSKIYAEFREIAAQIDMTKSELGQLNAKDQRKGRIPEAGQELHEIVKSTEEATNKIMGAAETIMTADPSDQGNYYNIVNDNVMAIFEACSFQDLTGQRISRVVDTLEFIDKRVAHFASKFGVTAPSSEIAFIDDEEREKEERAKKLILNGPQNEQDAISQNDIDSMLSK